MYDILADNKQTVSRTSTGSSAVGHHIQPCQAETALLNYQGSLNRTNMSSELIHDDPKSIHGIEDNVAQEHDQQSNLVEDSNLHRNSTQSFSVTNHSRAGSLVKDQDSCEQDQSHSSTNNEHHQSSTNQSCELSSLTNGQSSHRISTSNDQSSHQSSINREQSSHQMSTNYEKSSTNHDKVCHQSSTNHGTRLSVDHSHVSFEHPAHYVKTDEDIIESSQSHEPPSHLTQDALLLLRSLQQKQQEETNDERSTVIRKFSFKRKSSTRRSVKGTPQSTVMLERHPSLRYSVRSRSSSQRRRPTHDLSSPVKDTSHLLAEPCNKRASVKANRSMDYDYYSLSHTPESHSLCGDDCGDSMYGYGKSRIASESTNNFMSSDCASMRSRQPYDTSMEDMSMRDGYLHRNALSRDVSHANFDNYRSDVAAVTCHVDVEDYEKEAVSEQTRLKRISLELSLRAQETFVTIPQLKKSNGTSSIQKYNEMLPRCYAIRHMVVLLFSSFLFFSPIFLLLVINTAMSQVDNFDIIMNVCECFSYVAVVFIPLLLIIVERPLFNQLICCNNRR